MAKSPRQSSADAQALRRGLHIARVFSQEGVHPFDTVSWERRTAAIYNSKGEAVFEQKEVEFPTTWSQLATNVVASKYFYGDLAAGNGDPREGKREYSLKQLIHRVTRTIADWGKAQGYFATPEDAERFYDELTWLCLHQYGAFNSPVWFNVGLYHQYGVHDKGGKTIFGWDWEKQQVVSVDPYERPQASACFIISVEDSIDDIWQLMAESARLFKFGSGVGADWSKLRSTKEKLSGGGRPSGPVSFMRVQDATGATIKSGGKTRRAAIMQTLKVWHPDILEFVTVKAKEEKKAWALIEQGYDGSFNGEAYNSVAFQNVNQSVRVTDAFMEAVLARKKFPLRAVTTGEVLEEVDAHELLYKVAEGTWICGDPGLQYEDTIQKWHTCKNSGPINSSNPCVTGDTLVATEDGLRRIDSLVGETPRVVGLDGRLHRTVRVIETGIKPVYRLRTRCGYEVKLTADHRVWTENRGDVPAAELTCDDVVRLVPPRFGTQHLEPAVAEYIGLVIGSLAPQETARLLEQRESIGAEQMSQEDELLEGWGAFDGASVSVQLGVHKALRQFVVLDENGLAKRLAAEVFRLDRPSVAALLRGLFTVQGTVANYGPKNQHIRLEAASQELLQQVQLLLLGFGIKSKLMRANRRLLDRALWSDGQGRVQEYGVQPLYSLHISRLSCMRFARAIGFLPESPKAAALHALHVSTTEDPLVDQVASLELVGEEPVYDLTEPVTDHFVANGIAVHNCSEYMFLDNSACNLASLNLRKFQRADGSFDVERFRAAVRLFITAMEILVDNAGYPSEKIVQNSHDYRPVGLGFANLGAMLMAMGLPYDSDEGRAVAGAITAIMHAEAYARSAEMAAIEHIGPFSGFEKNRESMLEVIRLHQAAVEDIHLSCPTYLKEAARESMARMVALGERYGYRNAQVTVLAPTGTISFMMDCDTTGIEPDIALVKYKLLAGKGDGMFKIVNQTVPIALRRLGYSEAHIEDILAYIEANDTIEGAPHVKEAHLPVFDCAFKPYKGQRFIHYMGHIKMMAACQPFISGAISKTVNMPEHVSVEEIMDAYIQGWKLGLKALAIYRENSKRSQPLSTRKEEQKAESRGDGMAAGEPQVIEKIVYKPVRKRLPDERPSITHKFSVAGHEGYLHIGLYPDTRMPGEIFITMAKQGSTISGLMDAFATAVSIALQYGVPLEDLCNKFSHMRFEPAGFTKNPQIPIAKSIMDYIFRYLSLKFLGHSQAEKQDNLCDGVTAEMKRSGPAHDERQLELGFETQPTAQVTPLAGQTIEAFLQAQQKNAAAALAASSSQEDAPACPNCGAITVRSGACYVCLNCGSSSGCG